MTMSNMTLNMGTMKIFLLLSFISLPTYSAESLFTDPASAFSLTVPFAADHAGTKNVETDSYRIRSFIDSERNVTVKIMINRNGEEHLDLTLLYEGTKAGLRDAGLTINPFPIPLADSQLGKCFSALNGDVYQITYLNSQHKNIINIVISGKDLDAVLSINDWLRAHNK